MFCIFLTFCIALMMEDKLLSLQKKVQSFAFLLGRNSPDVIYSLGGTCLQFLIR